MLPKGPERSVLCMKAASLRYRIAALPEEGLGAETAVEVSVSDESAPEEFLLKESVSDSPTVKVKFELQRECHFGQQFNVVGDDPQFGNWEPSAAVPLNWTEGHLWTTEVDVPEGKRIEYKYVLTGKGGVIEWQPGSNHVLETAAGAESLLASDAWEESEPALVSEPEVQPDELVTQEWEPISDTSEINTPVDALADAAASAAAGALNAGFKAATALEGGLGAGSSLSDSSSETNGGGGSKEETPTAAEVPVVDAALAAAAEEVRGESKETQKTTSNDA